MNKQYTYKCNKIFGGYVQVRDYNLNICYNGGFDLYIILDGKYDHMIIPHNELKEKAIKKENDKFTHISNYPGSPDYKNYYFRWVPVIQKDPQQKLL